MPAHKSITSNTAANINNRWRYTGYPAYLANAAVDLDMGQGEIERARRSPELSRLSNLVAGTVDAEPLQRAGILREALVSHAALMLAASAASDILRDAFEAYGLPVPAQVGNRESEPESEPAPIALRVAGSTEPTEPTIPITRRGPGRPRKDR